MLEKLCLLHSFRKPKGTRKPKAASPKAKSPKAKAAKSPKAKSASPKAKTAKPVKSWATVPGFFFEVLETMEEQKGADEVYRFYENYGGFLLEDAHDDGYILQYESLDKYNLSKSQLASLIRKNKTNPESISFMDSEGTAGLSRKQAEAILNDIYKRAMLCARNNAIILSIQSMQAAPKAKTAKAKSPKAKTAAPKAKTAKAASPKA
jgi:hypothetical protein